MSSNSDRLIGTVLGDTYRVTAKLGEGGMGAVYKVRDKMLDVIRALKIMHPHLMAKPKAVERFTTEARTCCKLTHANIIRVHDIGDDRGMRFLTMEYLEGRTLRVWLDELKAEQQQ